MGFKMDEMVQLADVLGAFVKRSGYTSGQLSKLSGIPKPTIVNWLEGRVRKPRGVSDLLSLCLTLHLSEAEASALLTSAGHPELESLRLTAVTTNNQSILALLNRFQGQGKSDTSLSPVPFQPVADVPTFVGRTAVIAEIESILLSNRSPKFISIQGMGGVGKTALAIHLAHQLRHRFSDGILWARVSDLDTNAILYSFASAFNTDVAHLSGIDMRSQAVRDLLANKDVLIILDDVESSEQIKPLLPPSLNGAVIWTTRRQDLSVARYAAQVKLRPFNIPTNESLLLFEQIMGSERVVLERPLLHEISDLLGHLPLAIDIAAARLAYEPGWSTQEFLERVQQEKLRLEELRYEDQDIRPSFYASYDSLTPIQKNTFSALAIFDSHDFSDEAVAALLAIDLREAQNQLRQLFGLSLITLGRQIPHERPRYQLHALICDYIKIVSEPPSSEAHFIEYYLRLLNKRAHNFELLNREYPHLIKCLHLAQKMANKQALIQIVNHLYLYWEATGENETAHRWLDRVIEEVDTAVAHPIAYLTAVFNLGRLHERHGAYIEAEMQYEKALLLAREHQAAFQLSNILRRLGVIASRKSDYVLSEAYYKEGIQLARKMNSGNAVSDFLRGLGIQAYMSGDLAKAESFYEEGLALMHLTDEQVRQPRGQASRIWGLGTIALQHGNLEEAENHFKQALSLSLKLNHRNRVIVLLRSLATLYLQKNALELGDDNLKQALDIAKQIGNRWQETRVLGELGELNLMREKTMLAQEQFRDQYKLARILNSQELVAISLFGLARIAKMNGETPLAMSYGKQSLDTFTAIGHEMVQTVATWLHQPAV